MSKRKGLGRGLDALFSDVPSAEDRLQTLPVASIRPGRYQPRQEIDEAALEDLAASIRAQGVIQPVVVREVGVSEYELIAGERRWRASQRAGLADIPAVVKAVPDEAVLAMGLIENIQRQALNPIEEARGFRRLIEEFGLTHEAVAAAVGRSRSAVSNMLRLLSLPEPVQDLLHDGQLEMGHARALLSLPVIDQLAFARRIVEEGWSVREVERRIKGVSEGAAPTVVRPAPVHTADPDVARLAETLSEALGARVAIRAGKTGRGRLTIDYSSLEELDGLLEKLLEKSMR
ncbi:ParB/RepB/Spo0J family partition protein [Gulbenkiania mobilis]|uniref:ParB family chromosome partitioning protein n=1 Tax=Gulbenkiania mobilis TaxID=397457 RepID=A0ABY2D028_GULMO|nr:ParB/RepB/Spo0J family partition protein [Gulbenkiania mobilis]TCW31824.1 ParB family chromosome partitioning protein [Gulbenkiania mobilis]